MTQNSSRWPYTDITVESWSDGHPKVIMWIIKYILFDHSCVCDTYYRLWRHSDITHHPLKKNRGCGRRISLSLFRMVPWISTPIFSKCFLWVILSQKIKGEITFKNYWYSHSRDHANAEKNTHTAAVIFISA